MVRGGGREVILELGGEMEVARVVRLLKAGEERKVL